MNIQLINIIGDMITNLADFLVFLSGSPRKLWTNHKLLKICKFILEIPGISQNFGMNHIIN